MKKFVLRTITVLFACLLLSSCNTTTSERYFDLAVLNANMLTGFAGTVMLRELESPSVKMDEKGQPVTMLRIEELTAKIKFIEDNFEKLQALKETPDTRDMLQASTAVYRYVLPVYKTEYTQLGRLYDDGASKEKITALANQIHDKYSEGYKVLFDKLINLGKPYAERHSIKVNWSL